jgi:hypothetical protein
MDGVPDVTPKALAAPVAIRPYVLDGNITGITWELYDPGDSLIDGFSVVPGKADATSVPYTIEAARFGSPGTVKSGRYLLRLVCRDTGNRPVVYAEKSFQVTGDAAEPKAGPDDEQQKTPSSHDSAEWERETVANMQRWGKAPPGLASKSHYTLADVSHMEELLKTRAKENKDNAAEFLGDYGQATIEMWTAHVTEVMITEAEKSEFSVLGEICKFFIIKTVETIAGAYGGPFAAWVAEALEKELSHALAEKATEWTTAAGAELLSSSLKEGDIEGRKKEIEKVAGGLGDHLKEMSKQTIAGLPETEPAAEWLGFVRGSPDPSYRRLAAFRLPPLFPKVNEQLIRTTVAANIVADPGAQGVVPVADKSPEYDIWNHRKASSIEEGVIRAHVFADGFGPLRVFSAFEAPEDLRKELVGHPISEMPTVPLRVHIHGNTMPGGGAAGLYKWPFLEDSFAKVFPDPGAAAITRDQAGLVRVTDFGLPELIVLYGQLHSGGGHGPGPFGSPEGRLKGAFDSPEGRGQGFEPASEISDDPLHVLIQDATNRALGPGPVSPDDIALYVRARLLSQREAGAQALMEIVAQSSLGDTPADKWERITVR